MSRFPHLPERLPSDLPGNLTPPRYFAVVPVDERNETSVPGVALSHYFWVLRRHLWKIAAFVAVCVLGTFVVSSRVKPVYEATATVDVNHETPSEVVGTRSNQSSAQNDEDAFLATQVRLIQSDSVLRPVAKKFRLLPQEDSAGYPASAKARLLAAAPVTLPPLQVTRPSNTYLLLISYRSPDPRLAADVANAVARSYLFHTYDLRVRSTSDMSSFMEKQLDELKAKMERSSRALLKFEKDMDVVNSDEKTNILSARLLQLNNDYTAAQADRIHAESVWNAISSGSLEAAEALSGGDELAKLIDAQNQAQQRFVLVESTYGTSHPEYRKAASELAEIKKEVSEARRRIANQAHGHYKESLKREQLLGAAVAQTKAEWDGVNGRSFQYQQLKQEADTDKALYNELIRKIRDANINAGFQSNNIRIADYARPPLRPVTPNIPLNLTLAFLFSAFLGIGGAIVRDSLDTTLRDPKEASRFLETDVIGTLPIDRPAAQLPRLKASNSSSEIVLPSGPERRDSGGYYAASGFDEAIRTLRNTILLSDFDRRLHSILVTSAAPAEGKSTLAAHLAIAKAAHGKKTILVDADLRHSSLHRKFALAPSRGLSDVLTEGLPWQNAVIPIEEIANLSLLPAGLEPHPAADLIGPQLSILLDEFTKRYDMVILDSPPLLGFSEGLQMAFAADGVLIVSRAAETKRSAVAEVIAALRRIHANIVGVVLNQTSDQTSPEGYSYYGHCYDKYSIYNVVDESGTLIRPPSNG